MVTVTPERQLWWDLGVDWIQRLTADRVGHLTKHPSYESQRCGSNSNLVLRAVIKAMQHIRFAITTTITGW